MKGFGFFVLLAAGALGAYALFIFDPSVSTGYGNIYNIGRLQDRQNLLIVAGVGACIGTLLMLFGPSSEHNVEQDQFAALVANGNLEMMRQMLDSGAVDPNGRAPGDMQSWLRLAVQHEGLPQIELLLKKGANPALADGFGTSVLDYVRRPDSNGRAIPDIRALFENPPALDLPPTAKAARTESTPPQPPQRPSLVEDLAELGRLKESGVLTSEEFEKAKARVLAS